jgi:hypothetical protein
LRECFESWKEGNPKGNIMKKALLPFVLSLAALAAHGQGIAYFGNNFGKTTWRAPIYGPEPSNPGLSITGQSSLGVPVGPTVYTGSLLQGNGWDMTLYAGPTTATSYLQMTLEATLNFSTVAQLAGMGTSITTVQVPGVPGGLGGQSANFQVFAWNNGGGTVNDLPTALFDWYEGIIPLGCSPIETTTAALGGGTILGPDTEFDSFNVYYNTPEPTALALAGLGVGVALIVRRKKQPVC